MGENKDKIVLSGTYKGSYHKFRGPSENENPLTFIKVFLNKFKKSKKNK
jgi:hypothetical protein